MRMNAPVLFLCLFAIASVPIAFSANRLWRTQSQLDTAEATLAQVTRDASRIIELRDKQQTIAEQKKPDQDVIARVNAVLADAGIPSERFGGLRPEADTALSGATGSTSINYRTQSVRVSLNELSVSQIGEFIGHWCMTQPLWIPTRIELTHSRNEKNADKYNMNVLLSATYVAQATTSEHP